MACLSTVVPGVICSICLEVFRKPASLVDCQHTFCSSCLREHFEKIDKTCPICRRKTRGKADIVDNRLLREIVSNMQDFVVQTKQEQEQLVVINEGLEAQLSQTESDLNRVKEINESLTAKLSKAEKDVQRLESANHTLSTELLQSESPLNQHEVLMADLDRLVAANHSLSTELLSPTMNSLTINEESESEPEANAAPADARIKGNRLQKVLKVLMD